MDIQQKDDGKKGHFKASENGIEAGVITYTWAGSTKIIIEHTIVNAAFEGKGLGKKLVMAVVELAREKKVKIQPLCSYAQLVFERDSKLSDVLF